MRHFSTVSLIIVLWLAAVGCAASEQTVTPTESPIEPTDSPTDQPTPTETPAPTLTDVPTATPSATPEPEPLFEFHGDAPYIERSGGWDQDIAFPMSIFEHDGLFYFFRNSVNGVTEETGYATSPDLITWTHGAENPLITTEALGTGDTSYMLLPWSATPMLDGTFAMYFWSWRRSNSGDSYIGRITAPAPEGPYTLDPRRLFEPADTGWDRTYIQSPTVMANANGDGYVMLYQGAPSISNLAAQGFGWATSPDGVEWTRHGEAVFNRGETGAWDDRNIQQPHIIHTPDGYVMVYEGSSALAGGASSYGIATSADGITWTRHPANPIFTTDDFPRAAYTHISSIFYHEGRYYLLLELGSPNGQSTDIWLATYEGSLLP